MWTGKLQHIINTSRPNLISRWFLSRLVFTVCALAVLCIFKKPIIAFISYVCNTILLQSNLRSLTVLKPVGEIPLRELCLLQVIFRHGHRTPFKIYPTDPNPVSLWTEGLGQLTNLGRLQHYAVGEYLRQRYKGFVTSDTREVYCLSSGAKRSLNGAYALLDGMYPPPSNKTIRKNLQWQPILVEFNPELRDKFLQSTPNCLASEVEKKRMVTTPEGKAFVEKYKNLYEFWSNKSGLPIVNYDRAGALYKTLLLQKTMNLIIPDWAEHTWNELQIQGDMCYYFHFKTRLLQRLRAGPILRLILQNMRRKIANGNDPKKVYLFSGHGSNVAAVLQALKLFNNKIPSYTACIIFELYKQNSMYTVRLLYSNATSPEENIPEPHILVLPGCTEYCPLEFIESFTKDLMVVNWRKECWSGRFNRTMVKTFLARHKKLLFK